MRFIPEGAKYRMRLEMHNQGWVPVIVPHDLFMTMTGEFFEDFWRDHRNGASSSPFSSRSTFSWTEAAEILGVAEVQDYDPDSNSANNAERWHYNLRNDPHWTPTVWCKPRKDAPGVYPQ